MSPLFKEEDTNLHLTNPVTRDLPHSFKDLTTGWIAKSRKELNLPFVEKYTLEDETFVPELLSKKSTVSTEHISKDNNVVGVVEGDSNQDEEYDNGYVNNSIGTASTCLSQIYGKQYTNSRAIQNVSSIAFVGTVVGQLTFGYISDNYSRKNAMIVGTLIIILFSILCSGAWGVGTTGTNAGGLFAAVTAYRFFLGIGIGSEYPAGSVAAQEAASLLPAGKRNRWFCWFTNFMIDFGFVASSVVPLVMLRICGTKHLQPVWRITLGLGAIPPLSLFFMRLKYKEGEKFKRTKFNKTPPYWLSIKFYWFRLAVVAIIWFIYDFSAYAFGTYSSLILDIILGEDTSLVKTFGWNIVFNLFYLPGAFIGAYLADYIGPRLTLVSGVLLQAMVGYILAGCFKTLRTEIGAFVVVYGIFMALGEFVGDTIGLLASNTVATPIKGQYYSIAAAVGKIGAFVGTWVFPAIIKSHGGYDSTTGLQAPYWVSSSLCCFAGVLALFFLPSVNQYSSGQEDKRYLEYLAANGYDISSMGLQNKKSGSTDVESLGISSSMENQNITDMTVTEVDNAEEKDKNLHIDVVRTETY
ncbi:related to MFS phospholipid transporter (Git1) [Saccharomycodes ludwigii]|uniref:Related to MFS phospholipid transporter (Git1) n=1 Tax=Saccharomycodes ludwigii TaxID=36035 RepID=A0A376B5M0_9ASCO|nr:related to MFS phospholipid transporter (Git1) [Saccharomycodes ludwigii]